MRLVELTQPDLFSAPISVRLKDGSIGVFTFERDGESVSGTCTIDGEHAGHARFSKNRNVPDWNAEQQDSWSSDTSFVNAEFRRRGVSKVIYTLLANAGFKIVRSGQFGGKLSPDGWALWDSIQKPWKLGKKRPRRVEIWPKQKLDAIKPSRKKTPPPQGGTPNAAGHPPEA